MKKTILTALILISAAGAARAAGLEDLRTAAASAAAKTVDAPPPLPSGAVPADPFDARKLYLMPDTEKWDGPLCIQFSLKAELAAVSKILSAEGLQAAELVNDGRGWYARVRTADEFARVKAMRLTDYASVAYVLVNRRLY